MFEHTTNECDEQKRLEAEAKDRAAVDKIVEGIQGRHTKLSEWLCDNHSNMAIHPIQMRPNWMSESTYFDNLVDDPAITCLLYTSPSPRDLSTSRMPSSA